MTWHFLPLVDVSPAIKDTLLQLPLHFSKTSLWLLILGLNQRIAWKEDHKASAILYFYQGPYLSDHHKNLKYGDRYPKLQYLCTFNTMSPIYTCSTFSSKPLNSMFRNFPFNKNLQKNLYERIFQRKLFFYSLKYIYDLFQRKMDECIEKIYDIFHPTKKSN